MSRIERILAWFAAGEPEEAPLDLAFIDRLDRITARAKAVGYDERSGRHFAVAGADLDDDIARRLGWFQQDPGNVPGSPAGKSYCFAHPAGVSNRA